jgi:hypothetical protein
MSKDDKSLVGKVGSLPLKAENVMDEETNAIVYQGATLRQLCVLFKMDISKVKVRIADIEPCGQRHGFPVYAIKDAASVLSDPRWPMDEWIKRMNHADLPMLLRKEYWAGMRSRQLYEIAAGDLWPTDRIIEMAGEMLKVIAMSARLAADQVERETGITVRQREVVNRLMDSMLANARDALEKHIKNRKPKDDSQVSEPVEAEDEDL